MKTRRTRRLTKYETDFNSWIAKQSPAVRARAKELRVDRPDEARPGNAKKGLSLDAGEAHEQDRAEYKRPHDVDEIETDATPWADALTKILWDLTACAGVTEARALLAGKAEGIRADACEWSAPVLRLLDKLHADRHPVLGAWCLLLYFNRVDLRQDKVALKMGVCRAAVSLRLRRYREQFPDLPPPRVCRPKAVEAHRRRARAQWRKGHRPRGACGNYLAELRRAGPG